MTSWCLTLGGPLLTRGARNRTYLRGRTEWVKDVLRAGLELSKCSLSSSYCQRQRVCPDWRGSLGLPAFPPGHSRDRLASKPCPRCRAPLPHRAVCRWHLQGWLRVSDPLRGGDPLSRVALLCPLPWSKRLLSISSHFSPPRLVLWAPSISLSCYDVSPQSQAGSSQKWNALALLANLQCRVSSYASGCLCFSLFGLLCFLFFWTLRLWGSLVACEFGRLAVWITEVI